MAKPKKNAADKVVAHFAHEGDKRKNIPTAEMQSLHQDPANGPKELRYPRNPDLDPQLVWRGKDQQDWSDLVVPTPPLYIQEKVHPKALIDDLLRRSKERQAEADGLFGDLFQDFDGLPKDADKTEFYQHDANWANRMILGDSLQVMASLAEREGLRGKVQCIYFDPPYGIKFNSNFQWSTTSSKVTDGKADHITREPEQVKAFRDTWRDGIHSYMTYLRDRLTVARDLLTESGSIFVQIGDENVHRVKALMDEVFGDSNSVALIAFKKTSGAGSISGGTDVIPQIFDYVIWYSKSQISVKYRQLYRQKVFGEAGASQYQWIEKATFVRRRMTAEEKERELLAGERIFGSDNLTSASGVDKTRYPITFEGKTHTPHPAVWKTSEEGMQRLLKSRRIIRPAANLSYVRYIDDFPAIPLANFWDDTASSFMADKVYVVQTNTKIVERCILMASDVGDLVLDPTCGSGTTATVAEQWGRRWITIDTSRVALALARSRIMGAKYPFYLLADSPEGQLKEAEITRSIPSTQATHYNLRHGFVCERVPHITLKSIANNTEIDVIWDNWQKVLEPLREGLNQSLRKAWQEWEIPREAEASWSAEAKKLHTDWWKSRLGRQQEIDASIAAKAEFEYLYDKPYEDKKKVRVAGPFTVESLTPHRTLTVNEEGDAVDLTEKRLGYTAKKNFAELILENLRTAGVQQAHKEDKINFTSLVPWAGTYVCAEGYYQEGDKAKRVAIFIGPEFGTVQRADLVAAAKEAADAKFDALIACAFSFDAHTTDLTKIGSLQVLKARMNADLHMAADLKSTGKGNLFVIFGEPDIDLLTEADGQIRVKIKGVDVFKPQSGKVESSNTDEIACWFIDTDYNEESFFVRHAYFLGANDPYDSLKKTLKAEIDQAAWETLHSDTSRPFPKPKSQRIAVKVINHLGDEVMRIFKVA
jgi:adenine-specific DNA-methyltransferase